MAWTLPEGAVLGLWSDLPAPETKPGLLAKLGPETTASIAEAAFLDRISVWSNPGFLAEGGRRVLVFAPADAGPWLDERVPAAYALQPQVEGTLGHRLNAFFEGEFADGAKKVVLLIGEAPTLDPTLVVSAFLCLDNRDIVIGPRTDGGIYLIGTRVAAPTLFEQAHWDRPNLLLHLTQQLARLNLSLSVLPPWYGLETAADWLTLSAHVTALKLAGMHPGLVEIEQLISP